MFSHPRDPFKMVRHLSNSYESMEVTKLAYYLGQTTKSHFMFSQIHVETSFGFYTHDYLAYKTHVPHFEVLSRVTTP